MYTSVWWPHEEAIQPDSDERAIVDVFLWDYQKREGKARTSDGKLVDVALTDYSLCDLKIKQRNQSDICMDESTS